MCFDVFGADKIAQFSLPVSIAAIFCAIPSKVCVAALLTCDILSVALSSHSLQPDFIRSGLLNCGNNRIIMLDGAMPSSF